MKHCPVCNKTKGKELFPRDKKTKGGLYYSCRECKLANDKIYREKNKERIAAKKAECYQAKRDLYDEKNKAWVKANKEARKQHIKNYYAKHKDEILEKQSDYRKENKELCNYRVADWAKRNKSARRATYSKRRGIKLKATPPWLTDDMQAEIKEIYQLAEDAHLVSGEFYHVDHIVPLQGEDVCGLHVPWNLQVIPFDLNLSKGNRYNDWK